MNQEEPFMEGRRLEKGNRKGGKHSWGEDRIHLFSTVKPIILRVLALASADSKQNLFPLICSATAPGPLLAPHCGSTELHRLTNIIEDR